MARPRSTSRDQMLEGAMHAFWSNGFEATSMADLVTATGSTRQSIYGDFESKLGLYRACFALYRDQIVAPALTPLESDQTGTEAIARYFETQIALAESTGLPGPGCLVGNAMTEMAPTDPEIRRLVEEHDARLETAFSKALPKSLSAARRRELAQFIVVAAQGLWAVSRVTNSADALRSRASTIVSLLERELSDGA